MAHALRHLISEFKALRRLARGVAASALWLAIAGAVAGAEREWPQAKFTVFSAQTLKDVAFAPQPEAAPVKLTFYATARSPRYEYRGPMPLRFVDVPTQQVVAEATIPPSIRDALLLFTPMPGAAPNTRRFQIAVLDDGALRHGAGVMSIVNLSGLELSGIVGRHAIVLKPGLNPTLQIGTSTKISLRAAFRGATYHSYADNLETEKGERALLILLPPYYRGSLEVQARLLVDQPPEPPKPSGAR